MIFVDSDVLMDIALERAEHFENSARFLEWAAQNAQEPTFVAWHSISNIYYNVRREKGHGFASEFVRFLIQFLQVAPTTTADAIYALSLPMNDFEDAMQVAAAIAAGARLIVTRNLDDYAQSPIRVISPAEAVAELS